MAAASVSSSRFPLFSSLYHVSYPVLQICDSITELNLNTQTVAAAIEEQSVTMASLSKTAEGLAALA